MPFKDPEKRKEYQKKYREKNKEYFKEYKNEYKKENKEKIKEYNKEYQKEYQQTPQGKKVYTISRWKNTYGVVHPDYDALYETYLETECCAVCKKVFEDTFDRCLDHDHDTGLFRQVLCRSCNTQDSWRSKID